MSVIEALSVPRSDKRRDDLAVKIDRTCAEKAKIIAKQLGYSSMAEYLTELVRPGIVRDWPKALRRLEHPEKEGQQ